MASPTLQLSLGGVAFTLIPNDPTGTVSFSQQSKETILLQLTNFSGTLRVHTSDSNSAVALEQTVEATTKINQITPKQRPLQDDIDSCNKRVRLEDSSSSNNSIEEVSNHRFSNTTTHPNNSLLGQPDLSQTQATLTGDEEEPPLQTFVSTPSHPKQPVQELLQQQPSPDTSMQSDHSPQRPIPTRVSLGDDVLSPPSCQPPCPRWGHTMTCLGPNRILVYGGQTLASETSTALTLDDLHLFNGTRWIQPLNNGDGLKRQWHTATYLPERQLLIAFGGECTNDKTGKSQIVHPVMVLDTEIMVWYPPSVSGDIPKGRSGHTATLLGHELVVWGGVSGHKFLQKVAVLDTLRWVWHTPTIHGTAPRPRSYHTATACGTKMVVFGGNDAEQCFSSVHVLERTSTWEWSNVQTKGTPPCPRTGHAAVVWHDDTICIYGGWDPNDENDVVFGDSFLLNTETWEWTKGPKIGSDDSGARVGHRAVLDGSRLLVFGGRLPGDVFSNDLLTLDVSSTRSTE
jgi:hypothetical protein